MTTHQPGEEHTFFASDGEADGKDVKELIRNVETRNVGGLIFVSPPFAVDGTAVVNQPDLPRVGIMTKSMFGIPSVFPDIESFYERAMDYLAAKNRKKLGMLIITRDNTKKLEEQYTQMAMNRGLVLKPFCIQVCNFESIQAASNISHMMMRLPEEERPDGLILADDNLVEHASSGLIAAGVRVPDDVEVVAHCNFPMQVPDVLPFRRLGFSSREIMERCLEIIEQQKRGETPAQHMKIKAQFEDEVKLWGDRGR